MIDVYVYVRYLFLKNLELFANDTCKERDSFQLVKNDAILAQ